MGADPGLDRLAGRLADHWVELGRFFLSRKLRSRLHSGVAAALSPVQLQAISALSLRAIRVGDLAALVGLAESTTTRLVDRLERLGLVTRRAEHTDRRSVAVELTAAGRRVAATVDRRRRALLREMLEALDPQERAEYVRLFAKATAALVGTEDRLRETQRRRAS